MFTELQSIASAYYSEDARLARLSAEVATHEVRTVLHLVASLATLVLLLII